MPSPACDIVQGLPRLSSCVAFFACELIRAVDVSDHTLFIAEVSTCDYSDNLPLVFFSSRYHLGPGDISERRRASNVERRSG